MATKTVGSLLIMLGLDSVGVKTGVDRAQYQFKRLDRSVSGAVAGMGSKIRGLVGSISGLNVALSALSVGGLSAFIFSTMRSIDETVKFADQLGMSRDALAELNYAAGLSGVNVRTLSLGLQRMTRRVAEAAQGTGEAKKALRELGVNAQWLASLRPDEQFEVLADRLHGVENASDRVRLAMKLFDSEGVRLVRMMQNGAAGVRAMREEARELGVTMSGGVAEGAVSALDAMQRLKTTGRALGIVLVKELGPTIADITNWLAVHLPRGVDYAKGAFLGLKGVAQLVVGKISWLLGKYYGLFGLIPGSWGRQWKQMAEDFDNFAKFMEGRVAETATKIGELQLFKSSGRKPGTIFGLGDVGGSGGGSGGGPGTNPPGGVPFAGEDENARLQSALDLQLDTVRKYLMSVSEAEFEAFAERQFILEEAQEAGLISEQQKYEYLLALTTKYEKARTNVAKKEQIERNRYSTLLQAKNTKDTLRGLQVLTAGVAQKSRALFAINKAAAIGEATMNAYAAFNKALAQGGLFGYAAAAAIFATGIANVSAIASSSFGGGGGAVSAPAVSPSEATAPQGAGYVDAVPAQNEPQPQTSVNIYLSALGDEEVENAVVRALEKLDEFDRLNVRVYD